MKSVKFFWSEIDKVKYECKKSLISSTNFLFTIAALKCRQRKKQWLTNLQERVKLLANDNEQLQVQANVMRDEVLNLRSLLLAHKNCPMPTNLPPQYHNFYSTNKDVC
jgi:hypothetical protein